LGALFGFIWPDMSYKWGILLSIPAIAVLIWYSTRESQQVLLHISLMVLTLVTACLGAYGGAWLRLRRRGTRNELA
jgi:hypothetical protein